MGLIPSQGTYLGFGFLIRSGTYGRQPIDASLSPPLPFLLPSLLLFLPSSLLPFLLPSLLPFLPPSLAPSLNSKEEDGTHTITSNPMLMADITNQSSYF